MAIRKAPTAAAKKAPPPPPAKVETVTLKQLAEEVGGMHGYPKATALRVMSDFIGKVTEAILDGSRVRLNGLGIMQVKHRPERMGRNPATGEAMKLKASKKIVFRPAKELKEAV